MEAPLTTADAVIDALGGTTEAARKLGKSPQSVANWRSRKMIPPEVYFVVTGLLEKEGKPSADPNVFRMQGADAA